MLVPTCTACHQILMLLLTYLWNASPSVCEETRQDLPPQLLPHCVGFAVRWQLGRTDAPSPTVPQERTPFCTPFLPPASGARDWGGGDESDTVPAHGEPAVCRREPHTHQLPASWVAGDGALRQALEAGWEWGRGLISPIRGQVNREVKDQGPSGWPVALAFSVTPVLEGLPGLSIPPHTGPGFSSLFQCLHTMQSFGVLFSKADWEWHAVPPPPYPSSPVNASYPLKFYCAPTAELPRGRSHMQCLQPVGLKPCCKLEPPGEPGKLQTTRPHPRLVRWDLPGWPQVLFVQSWRWFQCMVSLRAVDRDWSSGCVASPSPEDGWQCSILGWPRLAGPQSVL